MVDNSCMEVTTPVIVPTSSLSHVLTTDSHDAAIKDVSNTASTDSCDAETDDKECSTRTRVTWSPKHSK